MLYAFSYDVRNTKMSELDVQGEVRKQRDTGELEVKGKESKDGQTGSHFPHFTNMHAETGL